MVTNRWKTWHNRSNTPFLPWRLLRSSLTISLPLCLRFHYYNCLSHLSNKRARFVNNIEPLWPHSQLLQRHIPISIRCYHQATDARSPQSATLIVAASTISMVSNAPPSSLQSPALWLKIPSTDTRSIDRTIRVWFDLICNPVPPVGVWPCVCVCASCIERSGSVRRSVSVLDDCEWHEARRTEIAPRCKLAIEAAPLTSAAEAAINIAVRRNPTCSGIRHQPIGEW